MAARIKRRNLIHITRVSAQNVCINTPAVCSYLSKNDRFIVTFIIPTPSFLFRAPPELYNMPGHYNFNTRDKSGSVYSK